MVREPAFRASSESFIDELVASNLLCSQVIGSARSLSECDMSVPFAEKRGTDSLRRRKLRSAAVQRCCDVTTSLQH